MLGGGLGRRGRSLSAKAFRGPTRRKRALRAPVEAEPQHEEADLR